MTHITIKGNDLPVFLDVSIWPSNANADEFKNRGENEATSSLGVPQITHTITGTLGSATRNMLRDGKKIIKGGSNQMRKG